MGSKVEDTAHVQHPSAGTPESQLVRDAREGDREAFELLVRRYLRKVHAVAASYFRERADVEDVAQEAFLRALENMQSFDPDRPFAPWLYQITRNVARNRLAGRRRRPTSLDDVEPPSTDEPSPAAGAERAEVRRLVADAVGHLPERRRTAFRLVDVEGYTAREAGGLMGLTPGAVRAHLHHARRQLRERLDPLLSEDPSEEERDDMER